MTTLTSTETELLPLFQQWAALEPDRCDVNENQLNIKIDGYWQRLIFHADVADAFPLMSQAIVQAVVQEAIAAHGFVIDAEMYRHADTQALRWDTIVYSKSRIVFDGASFRCDDPNPAIALLSAYIQALEANQ